MGARGNGRGIELGEGELFPLASPHPLLWSLGTQLEESVVEIASKVSYRLKILVFNFFCVVRIKNTLSA